MRANGGSGFISIALLAFLPLFTGPAGLAQGTIRFGFEEFEPGDVPFFVKPGSLNGFAEVRSEGSAIFPSPYEGERFLAGFDTIELAAPNGEAIKEFSLRFYARESLAANPRFAFGAGNIQGRVQELGTWQELRGSFETPVASLTIYGWYQEGEFFGAFYGVDAVQLVTVPEPQISWLLAAGLLGAFLLIGRPNSIRRA